MDNMYEELGMNNDGAYDEYVEVMLREQYGDEAVDKWYEEQDDLPF